MWPMAANFRHKLFAWRGVVARPHPVGDFGGDLLGDELRGAEASVAEIAAFTGAHAARAPIGRLAACVPIVRDMRQLRVRAIFQGGPSSLVVASRRLPNLAKLGPNVSTSAQVWTRSVYGPTCPRICAY